MSCQCALDEVATEVVVLEGFEVVVVVCSVVVDLVELVRLAISVILRFVEDLDALTIATSLGFEAVLALWAG